MWDFLRNGGPFMFLLVVTSIIGLTFIIERGLALRWEKVAPAGIRDAVDRCRQPGDLPQLVGACQSQPTPLGRLILTAHDHLKWPKNENVDSVQTRARQEIIRLERGLVVLEIVVGIAPLLGLVGTIHGLITLFGDLGKVGMGDNTVLAKGIAIALNTTLMGLMVAIPSLVAWSYFNKKVETLAVEMEGICDQFLQNQYGSKNKA